MASGLGKAENESNVPPLDENCVLEFDDGTLRAIAEIYKNEGNDEYRKKDFSKAIYFYTEGIKVKCKDEGLNAKLYSNRATAYFYMGSHYDSLRDAKAAIQLQPSYLKATVRGVEACVQLNQFEEAIVFCDKGLAIDKNDRKLLELRKRAFKEQNKLHETKEARENSDTQTAKSMVRLITRLMWKSACHTTQKKLRNIHVLETGSLANQIQEFSLA